MGMDKVGVPRVALLFGVYTLFSVHGLSVASPVIDFI